MWLDNFSHLHGNVATKHRLEPYTACLWTAVGIRPMLLSRTLTRALYSPEGVSPLPVNLFEDVPTLKEYFRECTTLRMTDSMTYLHELYCVPPGPVPHGLHASDGLEGKERYIDKNFRAFRYLA